MGLYLPRSLSFLLSIGDGTLIKRYWWVPVGTAMLFAAGAYGYMLGAKACVSSN